MKVSILEVDFFHVPEVNEIQQLGYWVSNKVDFFMCIFTMKICIQMNNKIMVSMSARSVGTLPLMSYSILGHLIVNNGETCKVFIQKYGVIISYEVG